MHKKRIAIIKLWNYTLRNTRRKTSKSIGGNTWINRAMGSLCNGPTQIHGHDIYYNYECGRWWKVRICNSTKNVGNHDIEKMFRYRWVPNERNWSPLLDPVSGMGDCQGLKYILPRTWSASPKKMRSSGMENSKTIHIEIMGNKHMEW